MSTQKLLVNVEATPVCFAACSMCPRSQVRDRGMLQPQTLEKLVRQIDPTSVWEIDISGRGEPSIHPHLQELAVIAKGARVPTCLVTTTAGFKHGKRLQACVESFDIIRLSVSSIQPQIFKQVHRGLHYAKTWRNIDAVGAIAGDKTIIHLTGGPVIYDGLQETVAHLREVGFSQMRLMPLWNRGGTFETHLEVRRRRELMQELDITSPEADFGSHTNGSESAVRHLRAQTNNKNYCAVGDSSICMGFDGALLGCFQDFSRISIVGHIETDSLRDFREKRLPLLGNMPICQDCDASAVGQYE